MINLFIHMYIYVLKRIFSTNKTKENTGACQCYSAGAGLCYSADANKWML